ncbi:MAG: stage III sporulation protein AF [Oscillospiraceae bacterium]|nr:stage III sporulation protein AF [Oscillospiraceae bacterium]
MSQVQQWAGALCLLVLISTVIQYVLPSGAMARSMKLVLGGFLVLGMIVPLVELVQSSDWDISLGQSAKASEELLLEEANGQILRQAQRNVEGVVAQTLSSMGIFPENITVEMDTDEDKSIVIEKVVVGIGFSDRAQGEHIRETLETTLGVKAEVVINGGGEKAIVPEVDDEAGGQ